MTRYFKGAGNADGIAPKTRFEPGFRYRAKILNLRLRASVNPTKKGNAYFIIETETTHSTNPNWVSPRLGSCAMEIAKNQFSLADVRQFMIALFNLSDDQVKAFAAPGSSAKYPDGDKFEELLEDLVANPAKVAGKLVDVEVTKVSEFFSRHTWSAAVGDFATAKAA